MNACMCVYVACMYVYVYLCVIYVCGYTHACSNLIYINFAICAKIHTPPFEVHRVHSNLLHFHICNSIFSVF